MHKGELKYLLKLLEKSTAKTAAAKIVSPYFGVNDFAFAYAKA